MRSQVYRVLLSTGVATATLFGTAATSFAKHDPATQRVADRDHDRDHDRDKDRDRDRDRGPREAPPPSKAERHEAKREGFVWVGGRWDWKKHEHRWDWMDGHWEREKHGHKWREARWEQRGEEWVLVDGDWIEADVRYPSAAPPALRDERPGAKAGFVWARGRWNWQNGNWEWLAGHWERERAKQRWNEGRWELRGDHWEWVEGGWQEDSHPAYLHALSDLRLARALVTKNAKADGVIKWDERKAIEMLDASIVVIKHASIDDGKPLEDHPPIDTGMLWGDRLHKALELVQSARKDVDQREDNAAANGLKVRVLQSLDGAVRFINEGIADEQKRRGNATYNPPPPPPPPPGNATYNPPPPPPPAAGPTSAPPPPREERHDPRDGFIWARGQYEWHTNAYEWVPGHWERQRARLTWYDGYWEQRGNVWVFVPGTWR